MPDSYDVINLASLPVPDAIVVPDAADIFSRWLARVRQLDPDFDALVESDPAYKQGEVHAYQLTLAFARVNDAVRAVLLASAQGADLDQLGAAFNVKRLIIEPGDPNAVPPVLPVPEEDEAFRARIQLSWAQLNTAGARNAYRYHARSADKDILDAEAYGPETHGRPGEVDVCVLSRTGKGTPSEALLNRVQRALNADEIRPLTDYVTVKPATLAEYRIEAVLDIPEGPDAQTVLENAVAVVSRYTQLAHRIHTVVPLSAIYAALQQPGVRRVKLISPGEDLEAAYGVAPWCAAVDVTRGNVTDE